MSLPEDFDNISMEAKLQAAIDNPDMLVEDYKLKENPGGRLGGIISILRMIQEKNGKVTVEEAEMLIRFTFVVAFVEAGLDMCSKIEEDATSLSATANEYAARFVKDKLEVSIGITSEEIAEILQGDDDNG